MFAQLCSFSTDVPLNEVFLIFCLLGGCNINSQPQGLLRAVVCWQINALLTCVLPLPSSCHHAVIAESHDLPLHLCAPLT